MQFIKNQEKTKLLVLILKILITIILIIFGFILINQINLPAPVKQIEKILPNENFKRLSSF